MPGRILIVDDDPLVPRTLRLLLAKHGHDVDAAGNAQEAFQRLEARVADVVISDINMPGLKGDAVVEALSANDATALIPIVYITSMLAPDETSELDGPFGGYIGVSKAASTAELVSIIQSVLR